MKDSSSRKLKTALESWQEILAQPADFVEIAVEGVTGGRTFQGSIKLDRSASTLYIASLPGINHKSDAMGLTGWLAEQAGKWDSCSITLVLRTMRQVIQADHKGVRIQSGAMRQEAAANPADAHEHSYGMSDKRAYRIQITEAAALLQAIGITDRQGKLKTSKWRKYHQIDRFVELAEPVFEPLLQNEDVLHIYDLACGKSYLSFVLNYYIREKLGKRCTITGIDIHEQVVESSQKLARQLDYRNMRFEQMDLKQFKPNGPVSLCISLHACDTATDMALAAAIRAKSKAILAVPCCQRELLANHYKLDVLQDSVMSAGILKARLADLITDGMRLLLLRSAGYEANLIEYISPLETPKNLMFRAIYTGKPDEQAWKQYLHLKRTIGADILLGRELEQMERIKSFNHSTGRVGQPL